MKKALSPGSVIGLLGSGQLGRMFIMAAQKMGYVVHVFSPEKNTPAGQVADREWVASFANARKLREFARQVDVVTYEFENIPFRSVEMIEKFTPVYPSSRVLKTTQHRLREKTFLRDNGLPVAPFAVVRNFSELTKALKTIGVPAVLKSAGFGYDGKGQRKITSSSQAKLAFESLGNVECILEGFVSFVKEISVIAVRGQDKSMVFYDVFENEHRNHILDVTISPARISPKIQNQAIRLARRVMESLNVVGVLCVEMFLTQRGEILINELAPRPHNSGHLTIDASVTSQFDQQVRVVCGLALGSPAILKPAAMANLLGDVWKKGVPRWEKALKDSRVQLHLYGKSSARPGRKMGHLTAVADTVEAAKAAVLNARGALQK